MDFRVAILLCLLVVALSSAIPLETDARAKRDVLDSMKSAWNEVAKTLSDAGDAVIHVFKPTERSIIDKMADGVKGLTN